jgi:hypothetical protein
MPLVYLVGCTLTDKQITDIGAAVKMGVETVATPIVAVAAPGIDAGAAAGIASALGLGVAYGVMALVRVFNKSKTD